MRMKDRNKQTLTLEDRVQRLEIGNLYKSVTHRLLQIYDEQRLKDKVSQQGLDSTSGPAVDSGAQGFLHVRDLAKRLGKSRKWIYANAARLGGSRVGRSWIFSEEALRNALLGQATAEVAGARPLARTKIQKRI